MKTNLLISSEQNENNIKNPILQLYGIPNVTIALTGDYSLENRNPPQEITILQSDDQTLPTLLLNQRNHIVRELSANELNELHDLAIATQLRYTHAHTQTNAHEDITPTIPRLWSENCANLPYKASKNLTLTTLDSASDHHDTIQITVAISTEHLKRINDTTHEIHSAFSQTFPNRHPQTTATHLLNLYSRFTTQELEALRHTHVFSTTASPTEEAPRQTRVRELTAMLKMRRILDPITTHATTPDPTF
jgi:hypothetical protein